MAITLLRRQSETPTVLGQDDSRILRYATGGYDGVTKGYADECGYEITGSTLHIKSGETILNGWQAVIDSSGVDVTLGSSATKLYFSIYVEYDLRIAAEPVITIKSQYDTASYPDIAVGEDLTENPYGIRRMLLYTATGQNNTISDVTRKFELCEVGKIKNAVNSIYAQYAKYASEDTSKGTIEERLTNLGFKQGNIILSSDVSASQGTSGIAPAIIKLGNMCYIFGRYTHDGVGSSFVIGTIPEEFRPKDNTYAMWYVTGYAGENVYCRVSINSSSGEITASNDSGRGALDYVNFSGRYDANTKTVQFAQIAYGV